MKAFEITKAQSDLIRDQSTKYNNELKKIELRRTLWKDFIRENIKKYLIDFKNASTFENLEVNLGSRTENYESLIVGFHKVASGIVRENEMVIKTGGYLCYAQRPSGKIQVFIEYPYITDIVSKQPLKDLGHFEPSELDEATVLDFFIHFCEEMTNWEINL